MALFRRTTQSSSTDAHKAAARLPKTMPTQFQQGDARAAGHETTYQSSRGGWLRRK